METLPIDGRIREKKNERIFALIFIIIFALLIVLLAFKLTYKRIYVVGSSMEDTLYGAPGGNPENSGGDFVYVFNARPDHGDVVVIRMGDDLWIKRVIGLSGDTIKIEKGKVFVNGTKLYEPYVSADNNLKKEDFEEITVPDGYIYFLGDNRDVSNDSRKRGCVPEDLVMGIVAEWSVKYNNSVTAFSTFFEFTLPSWFGAK